MIRQKRSVRGRKAKKMKEIEGEEEEMDNIEIGFVFAQADGGI